MKIRFKALGACAAVSMSLLVSACAQNFTNTNNQLAVEPDRVALQLASAVDRASTALQTLAAVEQKRTPADSVMALPNAPQQLMRTVTLDWTGPIEPLVRQLADRAGYRYMVQGDEPAGDVVINVTAVEKPVIEVLRDVGLQAGRRANVVVDGERQVIEVAYASSDSL